MTSPSASMSNSLYLKLVDPRLATSTFISSQDAFAFLRCRLPSLHFSPSPFGRGWGERELRATQFQMLHSAFPLQRPRPPTRPIPRQKIRMRPRNYVGCNQFPHPARRLRPRIHRRLHAPHIPAHDRRHKRPPNLNRLHHLHIRRLTHRVGRFHQTNPSLGLDEPQRASITPVPPIPILLSHDLVLCQL